MKKQNSALYLCLCILFLFIRIRKVALNEVRNRTLLECLREEDVPVDVEVIADAVGLQQRRTDGPTLVVGDAGAREEELTALTIGGQLKVYVRDGIQVRIPLHFSVFMGIRCRSENPVLPKYIA